MCRLPGADGTWMIAEGGMGTVSRTFADAARAAGARLFTDAAVASVSVDGGAASGVVLADGAIGAGPGGARLLRSRTG